MISIQPVAPISCDNCNRIMQEGYRLEFRDRRQDRDGYRKPFAVVTLCDDCIGAIDALHESVLKAKESKQAPRGLTYKYDYDEITRHIPKSEEE